MMILLHTLITHLAINVISVYYKHTPGNKKYKLCITQMQMIQIKNH